ncbi:MAG: hypothetical protein JOY60_05625 [Burkholderiaceae bacterium]|nr:hypothetical protein [Burkholderiaceae bacterium]
MREIKLGCLVFLDPQNSDPLSSICLAKQGLENPLHAVFSFPPDHFLNAAIILQTVERMVSVSLPESPKLLMSRQTQANRIEQIFPMQIKTQACVARDQGSSHDT